jgi:hypothetical protein
MQQQHFCFSLKITKYRKLPMTVACGNDMQAGGQRQQLLLEVSLGFT